MTKRAQWVQMPVEPADAWFAQRHYERALGADMFRVFGSDEVIDVPLSAFPEVICRRLAVDGRDRPTVKRSIERLVEAGLVVADGPRTHLLYSQRKHREWTVNGRSSVSERPVNDQSSSGERTVNAQSSVSETDSSARNDSTDASQIDREKERKKEIPPTPPGGPAVSEVVPRDFPDAGRGAFRQPPAGGAYAAEVRDGWASAWHEAKRGAPPRLVGDVWASAVAFARDVAEAHGVTLREAAQRIAEAALASPGDPVWHLTRLDPFAAPRPLPGAGNGMPLADQIQAAEKALREAGVRDAPMSELQPLADRVKKLKAQRDEREDQARRYARR